jgi:ABC-type nitrate/sulfonate/bicarbonate transport system substrate-binding protein
MRKRKLRYSALGGGVLLAAMISGLVYWQQTEKRETASLRPLTLGLAMQPTAALVLIAVANGYFGDEGLDVTIKRYPSGKRAMAEGLFKGAVDLAIASDAPIVFNAFKHRDFRILATVFYADSVNRVIARKDSGILEPVDLRGKRVGTQKASAAHYFLHLFLLDNGLSDEDVEQVFLKAEDLPGALARGEIDAFSMQEPYISQAASALGDNSVKFAAPALCAQTDALVASSGFTGSHEAEVEAFVRALRRAQQFAKENRTGAMAIVAGRANASRALVARIWPAVAPPVSLRQSLLLRLEDQAGWASTLLATASYPNFLDFVDATPLRSVAPEAATIKDWRTKAH